MLTRTVSYLAFKGRAFGFMRCRSYMACGVGELPPKLLSIFVSLSPCQPSRGVELPSLLPGVAGRRGNQCARLVQAIFYQPGCGR